MGTELSLSQQLERRGLPAEQFHTLRSAIWPNASDNKSVLMAYDYCRARGLDPFKRPVHIVPVYDKNANGGQGGMVDTVRPGIAELRTTAMRTGEFVGKDPVEWGPVRTFNLGNVTLDVPEYAQVTVYRLVAGRVVAFPGDPVFFEEAYATQGRNSKAPNAMWQGRPRGQLAKTAEAMALRQAFPEEMGGEQSAEEMEGAEVEGAAKAAPAGAGSGNAAESLNAEVEAEAEAETEAEPPALEAQEAETVDGLTGSEAPAETEPVEAQGDLVDQL